MHPARRNRSKRRQHTGKRHFAVSNRLTPPELQNFFIRIASPVLRSENTVRTKQYTQHGHISCYDHSLAVAFYSLRLANRFRIRCDRKSLVKGALLHDYFLYDWHEKNRSHRLHGFTHAKTALGNASKEFALNEIEKDIISSHMFPLNFTPPHYRESRIVCLVDKFCSLAEVFGLVTYPAAVRICGTEAF